MTSSLPILWPCDSMNRDWRSAKYLLSHLVPFSGLSSVLRFCVFRAFLHVFFLGSVAKVCGVSEPVGPYCSGPMYPLAMASLVCLVFSSRLMFSQPPRG